jgi:hypothetical protein
MSGCRDKAFCNCRKRFLNIGDTDYNRWRFGNEIADLHAWTRDRSHVFT